MPAAQAVTCPEGKEKPSSSGAPTKPHQASNSALVMYGRGLATLSLRMMLVISAPQQTAPKMHTPRSRLSIISIKSSASRKKTMPFSPKKVIARISGVITAPSFSAMPCRSFRKK